MTSPTPILPEGYTLRHSSPSVEDFVALRQSSPTITPINSAQASASLDGAWHTIHITHSSSPTPSQAIGIGRIISDGGWFFTIVDIIVLPQHQRKGLGEIIMSTLMNEIRERSIKGAPGAFVGLMAAPEARKLYGRHGFKDTMPANMGMAQWLEKE